MPDLLSVVCVTGEQKKRRPPTMGIIKRKTMLINEIQDKVISDDNHHHQTNGRPAGAGLMQFRADSEGEKTIDY